MGPREEDESLGEALIADAPRRGRPPRQAQEHTERRRRQPGSLNRMVASALSIPEECKDPDYHYHWVNDIRGRVQSLTVHDDYDIVTVEELEEIGQRNRADFSLNKDGFSGNGTTVSVPVERDGTRAVLLKKRQTFYDADYQEGLEQRQAMMESRVYEGQASSDVVGENSRETLDTRTTYVPNGNKLPPMRRKGPIQPRSL